MTNLEVVTWLINAFVHELIDSNYDKESAIRATVKRYVVNTKMYSTDDLVEFLKQAKTYNVQILKHFMEEEACGSE